jgi:hypothetical protein
MGNFGNFTSPFNQLLPMRSVTVDIDKMSFQDLSEMISILEQRDAAFDPVVKLSRAYKENFDLILHALRKLNNLVDILSNNQVPPQSQLFTACFVHGRGTDGLPAELLDETTTNELIIGKDQGGVLLLWDSKLEVACTGSTVIQDILLNGTTIFASTKIVIPTSNITIQRGSGFAGIITLVEGDVLQAKITQIGSTTPGKSLVTNLYWRGQII